MHFFPFPFFKILTHLTFCTLSTFQAKTFSTISLKPEQNIFLLKKFLQCLHWNAMKHLHLIFIDSLWICKFLDVVRFDVWFFDGFMFLSSRHFLSIPIVLIDSFQEIFYFVFKWNSIINLEIYNCCMISLDDVCLVGVYLMFLTSTHRAFCCSAFLKLQQWQQPEHQNHSIEYRSQRLICIIWW